MRALLACLLALLPASASAYEWAAEVIECLEYVDIPCADEAVEGVDPAAVEDPQALALLAELHFFAGRYPQAHDTLARAVELGLEEAAKRLELYERTMFATAGWTVQEQGRFDVRYRPGVDAVLVREAGRALLDSERYIAPRLGGPVPGRTILEVFPDGRSFIAASSLTKDDVRATGVVALSKWSRLLLTSPRALGRGYEWQDTIAHEYIHLVVAHHTRDRAPVWLQEAIAKYLDSRWRDGGDHFQPRSRCSGPTGRSTTPRRRPARPSPTRSSPR